MASLLLAAPGRCADAPVAVSPSVQLEHVIVREGPTPGVELRLSGDVEPTAHAIPAHGDAPPRVYLDLPKTKLGPQLARVSDGSGAVRKVRAGQFDPNTTRVVIELADARTFDVQRNGAEIIVTFSGGKPRRRSPP